MSLLDKSERRLYVLKALIPKITTRDLREFGKRHLTKVQQDNFMKPYDNKYGESYNAFLLINYIVDHINAAAFQNYSHSIEFSHIVLLEAEFERLYENAKLYFKTLYDVELVVDYTHRSFHVSFTPDEASNRQDWPELKIAPAPSSSTLPEL